MMEHLWYDFVAVLIQKWLLLNIHTGYFSVVTPSLGCLTLSLLRFFDRGSFWLSLKISMGSTAVGTALWRISITGSKKQAIKSYSHSFRITCNKNTASLLSGEECYMQRPTIITDIVYTCIYHIWPPWNQSKLPFTSFRYSEIHVYNFENSSFCWLFWYLNKNSKITIEVVAIDSCKAFK